MFTMKRIMAGCLFLAASLALSPLAHGQGREGGRTESREVRGAVKTIDATSITLTYGGGRDTAPTEKTYPLAKDVEFCVGTGFGGGPRGGSVYKEIKRTELTAGMNVVLSLTADMKTVESVTAEEPTVRGVVKAVLAKEKKLTISSQQGGGRDQPGEDQTYAVADNVEIALDDGRGRRMSFREGKLEDLNEGAFVTLRLSLDRKVVHSLFAEAAMLNGVVKEVNAAKKSVTLTLRPPGRGDDAAEERTVKLAADATVIIDDGKGRRLSVKEAKLAEVPVGAAVFVKLSMDQSQAMFLRAEGPMLFGMLKGVDADKGTITIGIPKNRQEFDEKTFKILPGARINIDGNDGKLADLKVGENGPFLQVRLTLDQTAAVFVIARQPGSR